MNSYTDFMEKWLKAEIFDNTVLAYIAAMLIFSVLLWGLLLLKWSIVHHLGKLAVKTTADWDDFIIALISKIGWPSFAVIALQVAAASLSLPDMARASVRYLMVFVLTIRIILLLQDIVQYGVSKVLQRHMGVQNPSAEAMIKSVVWIIKWALWVLGGAFILDNLGVNISSLMAGIGIGGIAVAMASQAVLGDAFSALSIYLDKPFEIGDFIIIDDAMGTVEHIGLKTTRIRSLSGEQLVFANSDLTKSRIKNYKRMQMRRVVFKIGVVYQTPIEKAERIPQMIKDILITAGVKVDRVHFHSFGDFALIYETVYYVQSADYNVYMDKQEAINLAIMRQFAKESIEFAYPTQMLYVQKLQEPH